MLGIGSVLRWIVLSRDRSPDRRRRKMTKIRLLKTTAGHVPFELSGSSVAESANGFLEHLATLGRSAYTIRSYAMGLMHFLNWVEREGLSLRDMTRQQVGRYIQDFMGSDTKASVTGQAPKQARTVNHRLSVLSSFFAYLIDHDAELADAGCSGMKNPVPGQRLDAQYRHGMVGRDPPPRGRRAEFRRRLPRRVPKCLKPFDVEKLISAAVSWRDKAILTLLYRTGQRIGDWSRVGGRHGVLGLTLADIDARNHSIVVLLKGARDQHRVPVAEDFWPIYAKYLQTERRGLERHNAAWIGLRRGKGQPLTYAAFEASLRYAARKAGLHVHAHMLRHTMAQMVLEFSGNLKVAQELLGHAHVSTTADVYMHVDQDALVRAVAGVAARRSPPVTPANVSAPLSQYAFPYDAFTIAELNRLTVGGLTAVPVPAKESP